MRFLKLFLVAFWVTHVIAAPNISQNELWSVLTLTIDSGGGEAAEVLSLLGTINDQTSQRLADKILRGDNGFSIASVASGLTSKQCLSYIPELRQAVLNPVVSLKPGILAAIARGDSNTAAHVLVDIADKADPSIAGVAFGLLEGMKEKSATMLETEVVHGSSAWCRETAASILRRMRTPSAISSFHAALLDTDQNVRIAGALGLAQWGISAGRNELEIASKGKSDYQLDALTGLAMLGEPKAFHELRSLLTMPDRSLRVRVVWAISRSGSSRLKAFAYQLGLEKNLTYLAMLSEKLLDPNNEQDKAVLITALANSDRLTALIAAKKLLDSMPSAQAENTVIRYLDSPNEEAKHFAISLALSHDQLLPQLAIRLDDRDQTLQLAAIEAISQIHQNRKFEDVERYLTSDKRILGLASAKTLVSLDQGRAKAVFEHLFEESSTAHYLKVYSAAMLLKIKSLESKVD